jgi:Ca2+-binding EF-hand superfamily protein
LLNKLEELFRAFDSDKDGAISADKLSLDNVTADILEIFTPLLLEMEANGFTLDQEEFIESSLALY